MAEQTTQTRAFNLRGLIPRKGMVSGAVRKVKDELTGAHLIKNISIGSIVGVAIVGAKALATGSFDPTDLGIIGGGAAVGVAHAVAHTVIENATDGAHEAIQHNRACDQIENALCQNPQILQDATQQSAATDKARNYQVGSGDNPAKNSATIQNLLEGRADLSSVKRLAEQMQQTPAERAL
ncbi:MAG: hypothetical protein K2Q12_11540 [Rickettsiales bacterium]|nr:hypothetical protein [Rickettsiales bacterium]